jgi:hypothetical protein
MAGVVKEKFLGAMLSVLCARYWYRGQLVEVGNNYVVLANPTAVEVTGSATDSTPNREDPIPGDIVIALDAVELIGQMGWVNAPIPSGPTNG